MAIKRVLIVDDSPTERHVLNDMLTKAGYEVVASDNGEDAILKAKTVKPDDFLDTRFVSQLEREGFYRASASR